jgi:hypothetical protein
MSDVPRFNTIRSRPAEIIPGVCEILAFPKLAPLGEGTAISMLSQRRLRRSGRSNSPLQSIRLGRRLREVSRATGARWPPTTPPPAPRRSGSCSWTGTLDGHVRVLHQRPGTSQTHIARLPIAGLATEETWVGDAERDLVMVITAAPSQSLADELVPATPP